MSESQRPLIGLTGRRKEASQIDGFPDSLAPLELDIYLVDYGRAVSAAGGIPVFLPLDVDPADFEDRLDGVLLTGGADVGPDTYGAHRDPATIDEPIRDEHEFAVLAHAEHDELPVLGICRGLQLVNVARGGSLYQDIPTHARYDIGPSELSHAVVLTEGSTLHGLYGPSHWVNSLHHQTVERVGAGLHVTARSEDGTIEGLESEDGRVLAVQWHPEMMLQRDNDPVFSWLIERARATL